MDIPVTTKRKFINIVNENRKKLLDGNYYDNDEIISLMNELIIYCYEDITERKFNIDNEEIKNNYIQEILNIYTAKTREQLLECYNKLILQLNKHLKNLGKFNKKTIYEIYTKLEKTMAFVQKLVNDNDTSMNSKRKLVDKLYDIVKSIC